MKTITRYSIQLVKEEAKRYEIEYKKVNDPSTIVDIVNKIYNLKESTDEHFIVVAMDVKCKLIGTFHVSQGSLTASIVHPREIFKRLLVCNAYSFVAVHNHPSGDTTPSEEDIIITERIKKAGEIMGISILDHIIIGDSYTSFKQLCYL